MFREQQGHGRRVGRKRFRGNPRPDHTAAGRSDLSYQRELLGAARTITLVGAGEGQRDHVRGFYSKPYRSLDLQDLLAPTGSRTGGDEKTGSVYTESTAKRICGGIGWM